MDLAVPCDRRGRFEPALVEKHVSAAAGAPPDHREAYTRRKISILNFDFSTPGFAAGSVESRQV